MGLNARDQKGSGDFVEQDALEPGLQPARVVQVIDLGLQPQQPYKGEVKDPVDMIHMSYELSEEFMKDEEGKDVLDKPRWLSEWFPFYSLDAVKSKSTKRYNAIDPTGVLDGEFTELISLPCQLAVTKKPKKDYPGQFSNYIGDVSGPVKVKGYVQPELINPPVVFLLSEPNMEVFEGLPEWLRERIKGNLNYNGSELQKLLGETATVETEVEQAAPAQPSPPKAPAAPA